MALRVVKPDDAPGEFESIEAAGDHGTARDLWATMRRNLARQLDNGDVASNAIASAYKELRELDRLIRVADAERAAEEEKSDAGKQRRRSFDAAAI